MFITYNNALSNTNSLIIYENWRTNERPLLGPIIVRILSTVSAVSYGIMRLLLRAEIKSRLSKILLFLLTFKNSYDNLMKIKTLLEKRPLMTQSEWVSQQINSWQVLLLKVKKSRFLPATSLLSRAA